VSDARFAEATNLIARYPDHPLRTLDALHLTVAAELAAFPIHPAFVFTMAATYTEVINQDGPWWVGWVEEVPGVNA
jgi:predicted RNase H-like HicB family nuclease